MAQLSKIYKVTKAQYNILKSGGTVGSYSWDDNALYIIEDNTQYVPTTTTINGNQLTNNIVLTGDNIDVNTTDDISIKAVLDNKANTNTTNTFTDVQTFNKNIAVNTINSLSISNLPSTSTLVARDANGAIAATSGSQPYHVVTNDSFTEVAIFNTPTSCNPDYSSAVGTSKETVVSITADLTNYKKIKLYFQGNTSSYFKYGGAVVEMNVSTATYGSNKVWIGTGYTQTYYYGITAHIDDNITTDIPSNNHSLKIKVTKTDDLAGAPNGVSEVYLYKIAVSKL